MAVAQVVLVAVHESLGNEKVIALSKKGVREKDFSQNISQIKLQEPMTTDTIKHSYCCTTAKASALYYLGGYVGKKA